MFEFKMVQPNEPLINDPFFSYLTTHYTKADNFSFIDAVVPYLEGMGFVKGEDTLTEEQLNTLKFVMDMWHEWTPWAGTQPLSAMLIPGGKFYVQGLPGRYTPTPLMFDTLKKAGWIADCVTSDTFFQVIGNRLYAKYSQILGSRFVCFLGEQQ